MNVESEHLMNIYVPLTYSGILARHWWRGLYRADGPDVGWTCFRAVRLSAHRLRHNHHHQKAYHEDDAFHPHLYL